MNYYLGFGLYQLSTLLVIVYGIKRFAILDTASSLFCFIAGISFVGEFVGLYASLVYHSNAAVYNVIGICNLVLICLYFNNAIGCFQSYGIGKFLALLSIVVWVFSVVFLDTMSEQSISYMFFECFLTMGMAIFSLEQLLVEKSRTEMRLRNSPHFWFALSLFLYWCVAISHWLLLYYFKYLAEQYPWFNASLFVITIMENIAFFLVFLFYPKLKRQNAT